MVRSLLARGSGGGGAAAAAPPPSSKVQKVEGPAAAASCWEDDAPTDEGGAVIPGYHWLPPMGISYTDRGEIGRNDSAALV